MMNFVKKILGLNKDVQPVIEEEIQDILVAGTLRLDNGVIVEGYYDSRKGVIYLDNGIANYNGGVKVLREDLPTQDQLGSKECVDNDWVVLLHHIDDL